MAYPVFIYNIFLIAFYVLLAAVFFYLFKSRNSSLSLWCAILFALAFIDNSIFFMKEVFFEIGHTDTILVQNHWVSEMSFQCLFAVIVRMVIGSYLDDRPERLELSLLVFSCFAIACITISAGPDHVATSALPVLLYGWVFIRGIIKAQAMRIKVSLAVVLCLYATDAILRLFGALDYAALSHRNIVIESYWTLYLIFGTYIAATLLRTAEETYTPDESVVFQQFLNQYGISQREGDIAKLLMEGATNQDISNQLFLALGTAKSHNYHIYKKLGIEHRTQVLIRYTEYLEARAKKRG